ncbi:MAG: pilus assembly protein TadG-related protein [Planktotalea sp.]|uniref:TadE/TadG family type IV pilus assembly protein n=1 Tax=Planktotalea sp. TaxID=2029877 RepID=UPI003C76D783
MRYKLHLTGQGPTKGNAERRSPFCAFKEEEDGSLVIFAVFMVLMILTMGGIGVDLMRSERDRTVLQHTLDRAVLAAADLDQEQAPATVVNDYFETAGLDSFLSNVSVDQGLNYKTIGAEAQSITTTAFMKLAGVNTLNAVAAGVAEERIANVEISMVLDISGSMGTGSKMSQLRTAATSFVNTVLSPANQDLVSVSLIPYSQHVNAGPLIYNELNTNHRHDYSHCIEMADSAYDETELDLSTTYDQMQHFQWNYSGQNTLTDTICPRYSYETITPFSQNAAALNAQIAQLQPRAGTQIFMGMKWAAAMLDPAFNPVVDALALSNNVDDAFDDRPAAFNDPETLKTVVLMTDGENSSAARISSWAYDSTSDYYHWSRYNLWYYLARYVGWNQRSSYYYEKYSATQGDALLENICDAAKDEGIVIWSIGFEVNDHGADVMENCASSPSHFFRVEGIEISEAFDAIARQINQLRLTQ